MIILALPNRFPYHATPNARKGFSLRQYIGETVQRVDFLGTGLLLVATLFLVASLEEVNHEFAWRSAFVITLLVISGIAWILFLVWERQVTLHSDTREPVFPWRFVQNRIWMGMLL